MATATRLPLGTVRDLFCSETGFQTPKIDTRAFVFRAGKVSLVREANGLWALPGGWCEVGLSLAENTAKEAFEEAGARVAARRLLLAHTYARHNAPPMAHGALKLFFLRGWEGGDFAPNGETTAAAWFTPDALPPLVRAATPPNSSPPVSGSRRMPPRRPCLAERRCVSARRAPCAARPRLIWSG